MKKDKTRTISARDIENAIAKAAETGPVPERDVALLLVAYGTGLMPIELAGITVTDYLNEDGTVREQSVVRAAIAFNGKERPLFWQNRRVQAGLDAYLAARAKAGACRSEDGKYRGLASDSPIFLGADGQPFTFTKRVTRKGTVSYSCESLTQIYRRLHTQAGITAGSALSARKTFMVRLVQQGIDAKHIRQLLGLSSVTPILRATKGVVVDLGAITSVLV